MRIAIVGGGILGLTLGYRLSGKGHRVEILEAAPGIGGLAGPQDYGAFTWDRFYHCILPQDTRLIALLEELGLADDLRWTRTGTGYYARGEFIPMNGNRDFLKFPHLGLWDKARLGWLVFWARRFSDPDALYRVTAEEWLSRICGKRAYEAFWQPLLKAKFGPFHDRVAAVFIYATLVRLFGARSSVAGKESLGYVRGGYRRILDRIDERLRERGAVVRTGTPVEAIEPADGGKTCRVAWRGGSETYDQVLFTAPTRVARKAAPAFVSHVETFERENPTSTNYLGVACLVLALEQPLTPYYVLNIGEPTVELTGLIEMTNLIDRSTETAGLSLVYLPRYLDSESPEFESSDDALKEAMIERGVKRLYPEFDVSKVRYAGVHRARYVQPLPLVREGDDAPAPSDTPLARPFQMVNTSMLRCATLNNDEVVGLADRFLDLHRGALETSGAA